MLRGLCGQVFHIQQGYGSRSGRAGNGGPHLCLPQFLSESPLSLSVQLYLTFTVFTFLPCL